MHSCANKSRGFGLVEVMVVMAVIFVMAVLMMGGGSLKSHQKQITACQGNLQTIYMALSIYGTENKNRFPELPGAATSEPPLSLLVPRSTTVTDAFLCPGRKLDELPAGMPFADKRIGYAYYMGWPKSTQRGAPLMSDEQIDTLPRKTGQAIFSADGKGRGRNHADQGGNVLFLDGSVETQPPVATRDLISPKGVVLLNPRSK